MQLSSTKLVPLVAKVAATGLCFASAAFGGVFAYTVGIHGGTLLAGVTILFAVCLELIKPLAIAGAFQHFKDWSPIRAHALMHQFGRERNPDGAIIATHEDYKVVYALVAHVLAEGLEAAVPDRIREIVRAVHKLRNQKHLNFGREEVSQVQIAKEIGRDQSVVSRNVTAAIEAGYLKNLNPGQGREASIVVGERELPNGSVLPHPKELAALLEAEKEVAELLMA
jgi:hypothetical protein